MVFLQEDDWTTAQTASAHKELKCPAVDLLLHPGTMLLSCLTMLVQEELYEKKNKKTTDVRHRVEDRAERGYLN